MTPDVPMFDVDIPVMVTPKRKTTPGKPRWTRYRVLNPVKCDDCMLVLAMTEGKGPASRQAKHRRVCGDSNLLLCNAHAQVRRAEDKMRPHEE